MNAPPSSPQSDTPAPANRPRSLADLFISFTLLALQGFGGVLAIVQREIVDRKRWLTQEEFIEDWAVAQIMPGPNVVNLSLMIGGRHFGIAGALAALAGLLTVPLILVIGLAVLHDRFADSPVVAGALHGMAAVCAGLIGAAGLRLASALKKSPMPFLQTYAKLTIVNFAVGFLLRRGWFHPALTRRASAFPSTGRCSGTHRHVS
jgi:chromate transporter